MAGSISNGAAIRTGEVLGADLCYLGTRFIATRESRAPQEYKDLLVSEDSRGLLYTDKITGIMCNWLRRSLLIRGLDLDNLPISKGPGTGYDHMPPQARPWRTIYSAGQGIELIDDLPSVGALVLRLREEYAAACATPAMSVAL
jgi:nitronate monooxygenase